MLACHILQPASPTCWFLRLTPAAACCHHHHHHHPHPQATSKNYKAYAERLASHGFAVLQYDFMMLGPWIDQLCHSDAAEVRARHQLGFCSSFELSSAGKRGTYMWLCWVGRQSWCERGLFMQHRLMCALVSDDVHVIGVSDAA